MQRNALPLPCRGALRHPCCSGLLLRSRCRANRFRASAPSRSSCLTIFCRWIPGLRREPRTWGDLREEIGADGWNFAAMCVRGHPKTQMPHGIQLHRRWVVQRCWRRRQGFGARAPVVLSRGDGALVCGLARGVHCKIVNI
jgi:hypothetical protein